MASGRVILSPSKFNFVLERLTHELIENYGDFDNTCIVGIQEKGVTLSQNLIQILESTSGLKKKIQFGKLDISFYRDDFRLRDQPIKVSPTDLEFSLEGKKVILIDDVLYSGRTIQAALAALQDFGRPLKVELLVMVDRRFNRQLPIHPDYTGIVVDALDEAYVRVVWGQDKSDHRIRIFSAENRNV